MMRNLIRFTICLAIYIVSIGSVWAQATAFTYQGKLNDGANPANGNYDIQFKLFDTPTVGTGVQQGPTVTNGSVAVTAGVFAAQLDFGLAAFIGSPRYLELGVRPAGSPNAYTVLGPRSPVSSTPYSVRSLNSSVADTLSSACVGCVNSTQIGSIPAGSPNYIQNTGVVQAGDFAIDGDGRAYLFNATAEYQIGGQHVLSVRGNQNIFAGVGTGAANTTGASNSFFGTQAGAANTTGSGNSFFGYRAGFTNTAGGNSFFGNFAGASNTTAGNNSFFGNNAGISNITGSGNSFFGSNAGGSNASGANNAFFGTDAGAANSTAAANSFFGYRAGFVNTAGGNSFFGNFAGASNTTATNNSFFGNNTGISNQTGANNAFFGSNAGSSNTTGTRNSFFGASAGSANTTATDNTFLGFNAGLNTTAGFNTFFGSASGSSNTSGSTNSFFGNAAGTTNTIGNDNSFFGRNAGHDNSGGNGNTFVGLNAGSANTLGSNNTAIGANASVGNIASFATAIGAGAVNITGNSIVLGRPIDSVRIPGNLNVTGSFSPGTLNVTGNLDVVGATVIHDTLLAFGDVDFRGFLDVSGRLVLHSLGPSGSQSLCLNSSFQVATCSSSLRYKTNVEIFRGGLDVVRRLRPITFDWKEGGIHDVGFAAEEVNAIEPLLTTRNDKGEIEGVKYAQITTALVNAVKEQQTEIEAQRRTNASQARQIAEQQELLRLQQQQLDALKKIVCQQNPQAACKEVRNSLP